MGLVCALAQIGFKVCGVPSKPQEISGHSDKHHQITGRETFCGHRETDGESSSSRSKGLPSCCNAFPVHHRRRHHKPTPLMPRTGAGILPDGAGEDVENRATEATAIVYDRGSMPVVGRLVRRQGCPLGHFRPSVTPASILNFATSPQSRYKLALFRGLVRNAQRERFRQDQWCGSVNV